MSSTLVVDKHGQPVMNRNLALTIASYLMHLLESQLKPRTTLIDTEFGYKLVWWHPGTKRIKLEAIICPDGSRLTIVLSRFDEDAEDLAEKLTSWSFWLRPAPIFRRYDENSESDHYFSLDHPAVEPYPGQTLSQPSVVKDIWGITQIYLSLLFER